MQTLTKLSCALALVAGMSAATAATVSLSNIYGVWSDANPVANATYVNGGSSVNWGTGGVSGYDFVAGGPVDVDVPPSPTDLFSIGMFTHRNQIIDSGTSITDIVLTISADISVDGEAQGQRSFVFDFTHFETPNGDDPCADGGELGEGVNVNGCADRVTVDFNNLSESFTIGLNTYTLNIFGFLIDDEQASAFWTKESFNNSADLLAFVTLRTNEVPEPHALGLLGLGLLGVAAARRYRRRDQAAV